MNTDYLRVCVCFALNEKETIERAAQSQTFAVCHLRVGDAWEITQKKG